MKTKGVIFLVMLSLALMSVDAGYEKKSNDLRSQCEDINSKLERIETEHNNLNNSLTNIENKYGGFQIYGEVIRKEVDGSIMVWGNAIPIDKDYRRMGSVVMSKGNLMILNPDMKKPEYGLVYRGVHWYLGENVGYNAYGSQVSVYVYGAVPADIKAKVASEQAIINSQLNELNETYKQLQKQKSNTWMQYRSLRYLMALNGTYPNISSEISLVASNSLKKSLADLHQYKTWKVGQEMPRQVILTAKTGGIITGDIKLANLVKEIAGVNTEEANKLLKSLPAIIISGVSAQQANEIKYKFDGLGKITIKPIDLPDSQIYTTMLQFRLSASNYCKAIDLGETETLITINGQNLCYTPRQNSHSYNEQATVPLYPDIICDVQKAKTSYVFPKDGVIIISYNGQITDFIYLIRPDVIEYYFPQKAGLIANAFLLKNGADFLVEDLAFLGGWLEDTDSARGLSMDYPELGIMKQFESVIPTHLIFVSDGKIASLMAIHIGQTQIGSKAFLNDFVKMIPALR